MQLAVPPRSDMENFYGQLGSDILWHWDLVGLLWTPSCCRWNHDFPIGVWCGLIFCGPCAPPWTEGQIVLLVFFLLFIIAQAFLQLSAWEQICIWLSRPASTTPLILSWQLWSPSSFTRMLEPWLSTCWRFALRHVSTFWDSPIRAGISPGNLSLLSDAIRHTKGPLELPRNGSTCPVVCIRREEAGLSWWWGEVLGHSFWFRNIVKSDLFQMHYPWHEWDSFQVACIGALFSCYPLLTFFDNVSWNSQQQPLKSR